VTNVKSLSKELAEVKKQQQLALQMLAAIARVL
jgi:hypothetical protein